MPVDVERLRAERVYESSVPVGMLTDDLAQIQSVAAAWRASRKRLIKAGVALLLIGVALLFLFFPVGILLIAIGVYLFFRVKTMPKTVANDPSRCEFAKSLVAVLAHDTGVKTPAAIRLAFDPKEEVLSEKATAAPQKRQREAVQVPLVLRRHDLAGWHGFHGDDRRSGASPLLHQPAWKVQDEDAHAERNLDAIRLSGRGVW